MTLQVGDGFVESSDMGPVVSVRNRAPALRDIETGIEDRAKLLNRMCKEMLAGRERGVYFGQQSSTAYGGE